MRARIAWMLRVVREARFAVLVAGAVVVGFSPGHASASPTIQLSDVKDGTGGFAIDGEGQTQLSGFSVSGAGDVNGDGLADLIVGATRTRPNGKYSGSSYVVFGTASGTRVQLSDIVAGSGGFVMNGELAYDGAGWSVSAAGDVNGDGRADLIVGTGYADPNGRSSGRSYVVFGKPEGSLVQLSDITAGSGGFAIDGESFNDESGRSVSGAGDVNGDGLADLIVGADQANANGPDSGRSYVVFGKTTGSLVQLSDITAGIGGFSIDGEVAGDESGRFVSGAGDVNGDGLADLIVGGYLADANGMWSGRSYVIFGKASQTKVQLSEIASGVGGFAIDGEAADNFSGRNVSGAGDVNGDGLADLIVGALGADFNGSRSGRSYVVFGKVSGTLVQLSGVAAGSGGFAIDGEAASNEAGRSVSGAGDINGDGLADLIVAAPVGYPFERDVRSYVIFGKVGSALVQLSDIAAGSGGFAIDSEAGDNRFGVKVVSAAGDVNGNGLADLILGAYRFKANGYSSGRSYVIFSPETPPRSAVYNAFSRAGDGPGGNPVVPTVVGDSRVTIDWPDDDFGSGEFGFGSSKERVVLYRSNSPVQNFEPIANVARVCWGVLTDRSGAGPAELAFKYLNHEIAGISLGSETDLAIFAAEDFEGPWIKLPTTIDAARNTARVTTALAAFKHFALAEAGTASVAPVNSAEHFKLYE